MKPRANVLCVDIETASAADLRAGAWTYSLHPSTRIWCVVFGYILPEGDYVIKSWGPGEALSSEISERIQDGGSVLAHNVSFERSIWLNILEPYYSFPVIQMKQWIDTQALGRCRGLPMSLEGLAKALGTQTQKDEEGAKLMREMSQAREEPPNLWTHQTAPRKHVWAYVGDTPANRERLRAYCEADVRTTLDCYQLLPDFSKREEKVWCVDQLINQRGVFVDLDFASKALALAERRYEELAEEASELSGGLLENATSTPALKKWVESRGVELPVIPRVRANGGKHESASLDKRALGMLLQRSDLPPDVRAVLECRREVAKITSLAKLRKVETLVGPDQRLRNALVYCGAGPGRWTSHGLQIHNLPKDTMDPGESAFVRAAIEAEDLDLLKLATEYPLEALSRSLRSLLAAAPGRELLSADYSAVEARVLAWLAQQSDTVDFFDAYDKALQARKKPEDYYVFTAKKIGSANRQLGKICALALGYGMGTLRFVATAADWGVPLELSEAYRVQKLWRDSNQKICSFWRELGEAVMDALTAPGETYDVGRVTVIYLHSSRALRIGLPSGRELYYWRPEIKETTWTLQVVQEDGTVVAQDVTGPEICFFAMGPDKTSMTPCSTYGGKLVENVTQAVARDLLADALVRIERSEEYQIVMHVHDSIVAEVSAGSGSLREFCELMSETPIWAEGLPIAVDGYRGVRFCG